MTKHKKIISRPTHRVLVRVIDHSGVIIWDNRGMPVIPSKWIEVSEAELGSKKRPNKEILEYRFEPITYDDDNQPAINPFGGLFR
jgi:hypothetical protein